MKMQVLAIFDSACKAYLQPIFTNSKGKVVREFMDMADDVNHPFSKHPEDYCLFEIGFWEDSKGELIPILPVKVLGLWEANSIREVDGHLNKDLENNMDTKEFNPSD